jgi:hypothetical protein
MYISDTQLKTFLSDAGLVSQKDFDARKKKRKKATKPSAIFLTAHNTIGEDELRRTYAYILGIPFVSLVGINIEFERFAHPGAGRTPQQHHRVLAQRQRPRSRDARYRRFGGDRFHKEKNASESFSAPHRRREHQSRAQTIPAGPQRQSRRCHQARNRSACRQGKARKKICKKSRKELPQCASSTRFCATRPRKALPTFISSRWKTRFSSAIASTASCTTRWNCPKHAAPAITARIKVLSNMRLDEHRLAARRTLRRGRRGRKSFFPCFGTCRRISAKK